MMMMARLAATAAAEGDFACIRYVERSITEPPAHGIVLARAFLELIKPTHFPTVFSPPLGSLNFKTRRGSTYDYDKSRNRVFDNIATVQRCMRSATDEIYSAGQTN